MCFSDFEIIKNYNKYFKNLFNRMNETCFIAYENLIE